MNTLSNEITNEKLIADFRVVMSDAEALLKATAGQGGEKIAELRARAEQSIGAVRASMENAQAALLEKTRMAAKAADHYVHENPWQSIATAAGIGLVIGIIVGRR